MTATYARHAEDRLQAALADTPVVLIEGPRQCGKTTLAQKIGAKHGYRYISFDEDATRQMANADPQGFVETLPKRVILDEIHRVPELFTAIKLAVDRNRIPGRFLLTGSVIVLDSQQMGDSLAGRIERIALHPLSQCELERKPAQLLHTLFANEWSYYLPEELPDGPASLFGTLVNMYDTPPAQSPEERIVTGGYPLDGDGETRELSPEERIVTGGYPEAVLRPAGERRSEWYRAYVNTIVERDVRDISNIRKPEILSDLLAVVAERTAHILSVDRLAKAFRQSRPTIESYLTILQKLFLVHKLPCWQRPRLPRTIKAPKLHLTDTGLLCTLRHLNVQELKQNRTIFGHILESFVLQELRRQASADSPPCNFSYYRTKDRCEVDIVIERAGQVAGIEVKASTSVNDKDFKGLRHLRTRLGKKFCTGVVIYSGKYSAPFGDGLYAIPVQSLWQA